MCLAWQEQKANAAPDYAGWNDLSFRNESETGLAIENSGNALQRGRPK